ncbi:MAG TPA: SLC13 family permease [Anaerolineales bacterium]|nr:SLC13 family permease [Anaerolineales bacterium]
MSGIWLILVWFYPAELDAGHFDLGEIESPRVYRPLLIKSMIVSGGVLIGFIVGVPIAEAALVATCVLLLTRRVHPEKVLSRIDWSLLIFFSALFIVSGAMETSGITSILFSALTNMLNGNSVTLATITVVLSNLISNVPAVLLRKSVIPHLAHPQAGWLTLAATSTLAGNLTLLGSVANLIVAEVAARHNVKLTFWEYTKTGFIVTILSLLIGIAWIQLFIWK